MLNATENADTFRKTRIDHSTEKISETRLLRPFIVNEQVIYIDAVGQRDDFGVETMQANALGTIFPEDQRLAVLQVERIVGFDALVCGVFKNPVIEDLAVLI